MDLYNSVKAFLKKKEGNVLLSDLYDFLGKKYSKKSINDFLNKNDNYFQIKDNHIVSYQAKIERFLDLLKSYVLRYNLRSEVAIYNFLAHFLHFKGIDNYLALLKDVDFKTNSEFEFDIDTETNLKFDPEFISTPEKQYLFTYQFFEFLISLEHINSGINSTPQTLIELFRKLLPEKETLKIYNPAAGFLNLATALQIFSESTLNIKASEISESIYYFGKLFSQINGIKIDFSCSDSGEEIIGLKYSSYDYIISNLPFGMKIPYHLDRNRSYKELSMHIISESIKRLNDTGRAVFLVNDGILFSGSKEAVVFRKEIITSGTLMCVISLPSKTLTNTQVKSSILVFDKENNNNRVQFIDATAEEFYEVNPDKSISLNANKIISNISWQLENQPNNANEPELEYGEKTNKLFVTIPEFRKNSYDLIAGRYIADLVDYSEDFVALKNILHIKRTSVVPDNASFPFIRITELNGKLLNDTSKTGLNTTLRRGRLLNEPSILIGTVSDSFKPTYFEGKFDIEVSNNIAIFGYDEKKVFAPYLVQELNADYVREQMNLLSKGSAIKHITRNDILSVRVKLPPIGEQIKLSLDRISFADSHKLQEREEEQTISDADFFQTFKHEVGNILKGPEGFFDLLPQFLKRNNINLDSPVVETQPDTIGEMLQMSTAQIKQVYDVMENMKGILFSDKRYFNPVMTELKPFIEKCLRREIPNGKIKWTVLINDSLSDKNKVFGEIDTPQFEYIIRNMVVNVDRHGGNKNIINLLVNIVSEKEKTLIEFINDGEPLPANFNISDFIQYGKKSGDFSGQGLGGYLINRVVKNHGGKIDILPAGKKFKTSTETIEASVHFSISIPKIL